MKRKVLLPFPCGTRSLPVTRKSEKSASRLALAVNILTDHLLDDLFTMVTVIVSVASGRSDNGLAAPFKLASIES